VSTCDFGGDEQAAIRTAHSSLRMRGL
jgi:hypothetical protein